MDKIKFIRVFPMPLQDIHGKSYHITKASAPEHSRSVLQLVLETQLDLADELGNTAYAELNRLLVEGYDGWRITGSAFLLNVADGINLQYDPTKKRLQVTLYFDLQFCKFEKTECCWIVQQDEIEKSEIQVQAAIGSLLGETYRRTLIQLVQEAGEYNDRNRE
jgi:hypothetical protein